MFDPQPETSAAAEIIRASFGAKLPDVAIILGSGLGETFENGKVLAEVSYTEIPGLPLPNVEGHNGVLRLLELNDNAYLCFFGRSHLYENYPPYQLGMSVRIAAALGAKTLITTSAVGSLRSEHKPGKIIIVSDHINLTGVNPLIGVKFRDSNAGFIDTQGMYSNELCTYALTVGEKNKIDIDSGIYAWVTGPSFETPAESSMISQFGADVVGMSLIPETITARQLNMKILAIACVTNFASGIGDKNVSHHEVLQQAEKFKTPLKKMLTGMRDYLHT